jgi:hypothetical protein
MVRLLFDTGQIPQGSLDIGDIILSIHLQNSLDA